MDASGNTAGWTYLDSNDETEQYDANGRLLSITNRQGMTTTLSYNPDGTLSQVRNQFGRTLGFGYNPAGDVETITDPAGGLWRYGYDSYGNLQAVTGPDSLSRTYHYEQSPDRGLLTGITDERGNRYATYKYDFKNRVYDETLAGGASHNVLAYLSGNSTVVTDALGTVRTYQFEDVYGNPKMIHVDEPCVSGCSNPRASELAYDANGFVKSATDFNGHTTIYSRNSRGLETARTEAAGSPVARTVTTTYDPTWRVATLVTEPTSSGTRTTTYAPDDRGNVLRKDVTVAGETRTWTYTYNALGQRISVDGPRTDVTDVTTMTYTPNGDLETVTDAAGNVTRFGSYDANGRAQSVTDPNGTVTALTYDPRGRLKTSSTAGETTAYDYDGVGNLQKLTLPDGSFLTYTYDPAQRLTAITDSLGNSVTYTLDGLGNRKGEDTKDPSGQLARTLSRVFDGLARLKDLYGAQSQQTHFTYDPQGNLKTSTDPLSHLTADDYDALNRLTKVTQPLLDGQATAGTIGYGYDAQDNLTAVTDPLGHVTSYGYSGFNELKTLASPDTGTTTYTYDPAGNVKTLQDARGQVATYAYDPLNRLKTLLYSDESIGYTYDDTAIAANSKGRLSQVTDGSGSTTYGYDARGPYHHEDPAHRRDDACRALRLQRRGPAGLDHHTGREPRRVRLPQQPGHERHGERHPGRHERQILPLRRSGELDVGQRAGLRARVRPRRAHSVRDDRRQGAELRLRSREPDHEPHGYPGRHLHPDHHWLRQPRPPHLGPGQRPRRLRPGLRLRPHRQPDEPGDDARLDDDHGAADPDVQLRHGEQPAYGAKQSGARLLVRCRGQHDGRRDVRLHVLRA